MSGVSPLIYNKDSPTSPEEGCGQTRARFIRISTDLWQHVSYSLIEEKKKGQEWEHSGAKHHTGVFASVQRLSNACLCLCRRILLTSGFPCQEDITMNDVSNSYLRLRLVSQL